MSYENDETRLGGGWREGGFIFTIELILFLLKGRYLQVDSLGCAIFLAVLGSPGLLLFLLPTTQRSQKSNQSNPGLRIGLN